MNLDWEKTIAARVESTPELQAWQGHLETRFPELRKIEESFPDRQVELMLELGCGNALASVYYSPRVKKIIASDLPAIDHLKHAIGLVRAEKFVNAVGVKNIELLGCSAESIPLPDQSVDVVLGVFCLEHFPNREKALKESLRVLKPGGIAVFSVPGSTWAMLVPISFYLEFVQRVFLRSFRKLIPKRRVETIGEQGASVVDLSPPPVVRDWDSFRKAYPRFPFPQPHGEFATSTDEILGYRCTSWKNLFSKMEFEQIEIRSLSVVPRALFILLLGNLGLKLYNKLSWLEDSWIKKKSLLGLSQFYCITARKPMSSRTSK